MKIGTPMTIWLLGDSSTDTAVTYLQLSHIVAVRLNAHVQVGYPEKRIVTDDNGQSIEKYYNSLAFVSPGGKLLATYAKHFLYYTDENWAEEGPAFMSTPVETLGQVGFGICMDVNPYQFKAPFTDFEFSRFHLNKETSLILCSMAWNKGEETLLKEEVEKKSKSQKTQNESKQSSGDDKDSDSSDDDDEDDDDDDDDEEDEEESALILQHETIQYWAVRMSPFCMQSQQREVYLVIANRIGTESRNVFVGSSCVLKLTSEGPELLGALPANKEGILEVNI
ncbi:Carbon-nitrogen hydrolase [Entomortierella chlamydospora]|nr:Carbon-nitrogen hydrolase [Entomortierella chlamydospora]